MSLINGLINNEVDVYSKTIDKYSDLTHAKVYSNMPCRWQEGVGIVFQKDVTTKEYKVSIWFLPSYTVEENYEVVNNSKKYRVIKVEDKYDLGGRIDHKKAYLA